MTRRLLPTLLAAGLGLLALALGLASLEAVFVRERTEALAGLAARRAALEQYGAVTLRESLRERLIEARTRIEHALVDPLIPAADLYRHEGDRVRLPRSATPSEGGGAPARDRYAALLRATGVPSPGDDPLSEREALVGRLRIALTARDRAAIETTFRALLAHRLHFVLPAAQDLPIALAAIRLLMDHSQPDPDLLRALLRDGLPAGAGKVEGLQRDLLSRQDRLSREDVELLRDEIERLSERAGVRHDDFAERAREAIVPPPSVPVDAAAPTAPLTESLRDSNAAAPTAPLTESLRDSNAGGPLLLAGGRWIVEPHDGLVSGVAVPLAELTESATREMVKRSLLSAGDRLLLDPPPVDTSLELLNVSVNAPALDLAARRVSRNFALKTGLVGACGVLFVSLALLLVLLQERKERYLKLRSDFVATVSHELRTPLAGIRLLAETLELRRADPSSARDYPRRIVKEVDGLTFLVENILSFGRLEKGRVAPRRERVDLTEVAAAVVDEASERSASQVRLEVTAASDAAVLTADLGLMRLLLANLVHNALRYSSRTPVQLDLRARRTESSLTVELRDNGDGIPQGEEEKVFGEFYRVPRRDGRPDGGSGLGLAICRRVMALHGGTIRVLRSGPEGTTFEMSFPA